MINVSVGTLQRKLSRKYESLKLRNKKMKGEDINE